MQELVKDLTVQQGSPLLFTPFDLFFNRRRKIIAGPGMRAVGFNLIEYLCLLRLTVKLSLT